MACSTTSPAGSPLGTATSIPPGRPRSLDARYEAAAWLASSTLRGAAMPEAGEKKAGKSLVPYAAAGTPRLSSFSRVRGMSSTDLMPADTTRTGVLASSYRSADTSMVICPSRWTPPVPPVTKTSIPARCASLMVEATVVAPQSPGRRLDR